MVGSQPVHDIERVIVLLDEAYDILADVFSKPIFEVNDSVITREIFTECDFDAETFDRCLQSIVQNLHASLLIAAVRVRKNEQREQRHHHLLWQREPGRVVEGYLAAVGHHSVDEVQLLGFERKRCVAFVECIPICIRKLSDQPIDYRKR